MVRLAEDVDRVTRDESRFMLRDFQSRNVMVKDGEVYFIDYQGGRRGPSAYDLASFSVAGKGWFFT